MLVGFGWWFVCLVCLVCDCGLGDLVVWWLGSVCFVAGFGFVWLGCLLVIGCCVVLCGLVMVNSVVHFMV